MRDLIQLEAWVYDVIDRVKRGIAIEDDRIEFKREWPLDYYRAARLIAGFANAARGGEVLLLVGVDPKQDPYFFHPGSIEPANWFPQVFSHFADKHAPPYRIFQIHGTHGAPVAVAFDSEGAPFLVKNPNYGNKLGEVIESEVPWRGSTSVRSAKRREFLGMMYRQTLVPDVQTFDYKVRHKGEGTLRYFEIEFTILIICASPRPIVIPLNRVSWRVGLSSDSEGAPAKSDYYEPETKKFIDTPYLIVSPVRAFRVTLWTEHLVLQEGQLWIQAHFEFGPEQPEKNFSFAVPVEW
jgi:hypothetical protein